MALKDLNIGSYLKSYKGFEKYNFLKSNRYKLYTTSKSILVSEYGQKNKTSEVAGVSLMVFRIDDSKYANVAFIYTGNIYIDKNGMSKLKSFNYDRTLKSKKDSAEVASFRNEEKDLTSLFKNTFNNDMIQARLLNTGTTPGKLRR